MLIGAGAGAAGAGDGAVGAAAAGAAAAAVSVRSENAMIKQQYTQDYKLALSKLCELKVQVLRHWVTVEQVSICSFFFFFFFFFFSQNEGTRKNKQEKTPPSVTQHPEGKNLE